MPIAIIGMHRSGTSMVARMMHICGLNLGKESDFSEVADDNPEGFWEHRGFRQINDAVLTSCTGAWDFVPRLNPGWETSPSLDHLYKKAETLIASFSDSQSVWGWKDPRTSLLLPFWKRLIPDLKFLVCLRNPMGVSASLAKRGYASVLFSSNLWLKYNQAILQNTSPEERIITHYDIFFAKPEQELQRLVAFAGLGTSDSLIETAANTISSQLRHHKSPALAVDFAAGPVVLAYNTLCMQAGPVYADCFSEQLAEQNAIVDLEQEVATDTIATESQDFVESNQIKSFRKKTFLLRVELKQKEHQLAALQKKIARLDQIVAQQRVYKQTLSQIQNGAAWKFLDFSRQARLTFIPLGSRRERFLHQVYSLLRLKESPEASAVIPVPLEQETKLTPKEMPATVKQNPGLMPDQNINDDALLQIYSDMLAAASGTANSLYVPLNDETLAPAERLVKFIAFYLPQFHPIPENDAWWGKGFVEWTNVSKAVPQFGGHYQPHLPGELGFYDLRIPEVQKRQVELARQYGIHGFAFHYYWFSGKRLLEKPLDLFLNSKEDFPFCICWANENWTRRWDGQEQDVLMEQKYSPENALQFIKDIEPILKDPRYIRIDGRPVLIVYRANLIPDIQSVVQCWRQYCQENKIGDPYLVAAQTFGFEDPGAVHFDAAVEFPPHNMTLTNMRYEFEFANTDYLGNIFSYKEILQRLSALPPTKYKLFNTVFPMWDNEARKPGRGHTFIDSTPELYKAWLLSVSRAALKDPNPGHHMVFINAWNEWAEGAHLEPDRKYGYAYLQATLDALKELRKEHSDTQL